MNNDDDDDDDDDDPHMRSKHVTESLSTAPGPRHLSLRRPPQEYSDDDGDGDDDDDDFSQKNSW
eukprot:9383571-Lingulodinium_polyedra.AAC.1